MLHLLLYFNDRYLRSLKYLTVNYNSLTQKQRNKIRCDLKRLADKIAFILRSHSKDSKYLLSSFLCYELKLVLKHHYFIYGINYQDYNGKISYNLSINKGVIISCCNPDYLSNPTQRGKVKGVSRYPRDQSGLTWRKIRELDTVTFVDGEAVNKYSMQYFSKTAINGYFKKVSGFIDYAFYKAKNTVATATELLQDTQKSENFLQSL